MTRPYKAIDLALGKLLFLREGLFTSYPEKMLSPSRSPTIYFNSVMLRIVGDRSACEHSLNKLRCFKCYHQITCQESSSTIRHNGLWMFGLIVSTAFKQAPLYDTKDCKNSTSFCKFGHHMTCYEISLKGKWNTIQDPQAFSFWNLSFKGKGKTPGHINAFKHFISLGLI